MECLIKEQAKIVIFILVRNVFDIGNKVSVFIFTRTSAYRDDQISVKIACIRHPVKIFRVKIGTKVEIKKGCAESQSRSVAGLWKFGLNNG